MQTSNDEEVLEAKEVTDVDRFWLTLGQETLKESIAALEGAAKQLISIVSVLQGIYFAAISFSNLKQILVVQSAQGWLLVITFVLPIALWLASLVFAINVFTPRLYSINLSSPQMTQDTYDTLVKAKHRELRKAHVLLVAGFVPLIISIIVYLAWV